MMNFFKIMSDNPNKEDTNIIEEEDKKEKQKEKEPPLNNENENNPLPIKEEKEIEIHDFYRCPKCKEIPFIKIDKTNYTLITECNNNHKFDNISVEKFISDLKKANLELNDKEKINLMILYVPITRKNISIIAKLVKLIYVCIVITASMNRTM